MRLIVALFVRFWRGKQPEISHAYAAGDSASQSIRTLSQESARIVALFLEGKDAGAIVADVFGLSSKGGQPYMRKLSEVQAVIREAMREVVIR